MPTVHFPYGKRYISAELPLNRLKGVLVSKLSACGIIPRLIINRFKPKGRDGKYINIDNIIDTSMARLLGVVPEDKNITSLDGPILLGTAAAAIFRIAARIEGRDIPLPKIKNII